MQTSDVAHVGEMRSAYNILVGNSVGKRPLEDKDRTN
jgi:hypothetical protein